MESDMEMDFQSQGYDQGEREAMVAWERSKWMLGLILRWDAQDLLMHVIRGFKRAGTVRNAPSLQTCTPIVLILK